MIIVRIVTGIRQHFGMRVTEWIMTGALFGFSLVLHYDPSTFGTSRSFAEIQRYGDEAFWSTVCVAVALIRLTALVINGTFQGFRYAPHLRGCASFVACGFWGLITMGILLAFGQGGALTGVISYGTLMAIEVWNLLRASADVGAQRKAQ